MNGGSLDASLGVTKRLAALSLAFLGLLALRGGLGTGLALLSPLAWLLRQARVGHDKHWIKPASAPLRWEPVFFAVLLLSALALRLVGLGTWPAGPGFVESVMGVEASALAQAPYAAHGTNVQAHFPTLLQYQGLAAARCFGWSLAALRSPAALWGALSVAAFYFFLRQITSPATAALFSVLFSVNVLQLTLSRLFFPGSLLFFSATATAALLLAGLRQGRWFLFAAAGLACGLSLHGYFPGRAVPPAFLAWLAWQAWAKPSGQAAPSWRLVACFALGCLVSAAPVLAWALAHPWAYWVVVGHYSGGTVEAVRRFAAALPDYGAMFYSRPDGILEPTDGLALFPLLQPDPLTQLCLPLGLLLCLFSLGSPLSVLLLGGFLLGLAPAAAALGYPAPCTRRALEVLPWCYAAAALAWDRLARLWPDGAAGRRARMGLAAVAAALCAGTVAWSLREYFIDIMERPSVRSAYNVAASLTGSQISAHPGAAVMASYGLAEPKDALLAYEPETGGRVLRSFHNFLLLDWPRDRPVSLRKQWVDFLDLDPGRDQLMLMEPALWVTWPLLQRLFPHGRGRVMGEARDYEAAQPWDAYAPDIDLFIYSVPKEDAQAFRGWADLSSAGPTPPRLDTGRPGFAAAQAGRSLDLGALLLRQQAGGGLRFSLGWPGWRLRIDGQDRTWGQSLALALGAHRIELRGRVPAGARGPLPLRMEDGRPGAEEALFLLPWDIRYGLRTDYLTGPGSPSAVAYDPLPFHRFTAPEAATAPYGVQWTGRLRLPSPGQWRLRVRPPFAARVALGGRTVFDSLSQPGSQAWAYASGPGALVPLRVQGVVQSGALAQATVLLEVEAPGEAVWRPLPYTWVLAP